MFQSEAKVMCESISVLLSHELSHSVIIGLVSGQSGSSCKNCASSLGRTTKAESSDSSDPDSSVPISRRVSIGGS